MQLYIVAAQLLFAGTIGFATPVGYWTYPVMLVLVAVPLYALAKGKTLRALPLWMRLVDIAAIALVLVYACILVLYAVLFHNFTF